ncbi:protein of unknown function [Amycolatopsis saalfeldensis]|uniref:DUF4185 domain-containing protein n=2 Tax=Amycolatopsis saalfeldensis TaxID=394193 RepID=A0A1H8YP50_9PSEU|nr:protein of unknown function [Amycolatopsis saalfeldensis]
MANDHHPTPTGASTAPAGEPICLVFHVSGRLRAACVDRSAAELFVLNTYDPNTFEIVELPLLDSGAARQAGLALLRRSLTSLAPQVVDSSDPAAIEEKVRTLWRERTGTDWADVAPPPLPDIDLDALGCGLQRDYLRESEWHRYADTRTGWLASNGGYCVVLPGRRELWICGDTFLPAAGQGENMMVRNSFVLDDGTTRTTYTGSVGADGQRADMIPAPGPDESGQPRWYRPSAGLATTDDTELVVFAHRQVATGTGIADSAFTGTALARFTLPDLTLIEVTDLHPGPIQWGAAAQRHGEYTLVFGVEDLGADKWLHLARVPDAQLADPEAKWEFWQGERWSADSADSVRLLHGVANEFGVLPVPERNGGGWVLLTHDTREPFSPDIVSYRAAQPWGPWTSPTLVYRTPETTSSVVTCNAKPHPGIWTGRAGDVLVNYSVNHRDLAQADSTTCRWRWLRVPLTTLIGDRQPH